ncbi:endonuclease/exonuclease/phosphatase family protein [Psychromonas sp. Urea-02u-13]|uniref:endonuclease/exonuclease/phosphatase family protein n=1 Tax=Psychromonas sp. Urea-02u-13 TaxID=2058326 RepID=UPI001E62C02C|nr:endonuclease/exonuclease/phosphatase family protein [Psychromonas sp. Urea-02u-13]
MDRQLTFPLITMIRKPICIVILLLLTVLGLGNAHAFFPDSPEQLTILAKNNQYYQTQCPILSKASINTNQKELSSPFTLLNWNIFKQQNQNWENSLKEWADRADFITLQEAKLSPALIQFSVQKELSYLHNYAFKYNNFIYGVNTLSRVAPLSLCGSAYPEPWIWVPKTGLASTYPIQGSQQTLLLINLHGVNFTLTEQPLREQLSPYLALIKQHSGPIIFSGDFNTWTDARLSEVKQSLIKSGFSEALFDDDQRLTVFGLPLDHIYFRGLNVIEAKSIITDASDHNPQLVTFELSPSVINL